jgi:nucleotide-binding universal stress UspA family protein
MKILLAIDSSALSEMVVTELESRLWPPKTEVRVLTVIDLFALTSSVGYLEPFIKGENDAAKAFVHAAAERLTRGGFMATGIVVEGYPGTSIVEEADRWDADLVMVGSHGHSGFVRFLLGSIAKAVVQNAACSVEIVRDPGHDKEARQPESASSAPEGLRLLFATDGSDYSQAAAHSIASRPWPAGSQIKIVSVVEPLMPATDPWFASGAITDTLRDENARKSGDAVEAAREIISRTGMTIETAVVDGIPKKRVVELARDWRANLIVVGSHGRRGVLRYLLGSVSEAVAMQAHCSVEVIRDRALLELA